MLENIKESLEWDVDMDETEGDGERKDKEDGEEMMLDPEREYPERRCNVQDTTLKQVYSSFPVFGSTGLPPRHEETIETYKKTLINLNEVLSVSLDVLLLLSCPSHVFHPRWHSVPRPCSRSVVLFGVSDRFYTDLYLPFDPARRRRTHRSRYHVQNEQRPSERRS